MNKQKLKHKHNYKPVGAMLRRCPKPQKNTQKGITLIALVITIIILLILAMVSIKLVMNSGILDKSKQAVDRYRDEQNKELAYLEDIYDEMEDISGEYDPEKGAAVIRDTNVYYDSLAKAIEAVPESTEQTIVMLQDVSETVTIGAKQNIKLNLGKIKITGSITNNGTLTIRGNGTIEGSENPPILLEGEEATLNIAGGTIKSGDVNFVIKVNSEKTTINMTGGTIINNQQSPCIYVLKADTNIVVSGGRIAGYIPINGGGVCKSVTLKENAIIDADLSAGGPAMAAIQNVNIEGGKITASGNFAPMISVNNLRVTGGEFDVSCNGSPVISGANIVISRGVTIENKGNHNTINGTNITIEDATILNNSNTNPTIVAAESFHMKSGLVKNNQDGGIALGYKGTDENLKIEGGTCEPIERR